MTSKKRKLANGSAWRLANGVCTCKEMRDNSMLTHPYALTRHQWRILFRHARTIAKGSYKTRYSAMQVALDHLIEVGFIPPTQLTATTEGGYWYTGISLSDAMYRYPIQKGCLAERLAFYKRQKQVA